MSVGPLQILLILALVLILFGGGKIPGIMGDVAKGIRNFRAALKDDGSESKNDASKPKREISSRPDNGPSVQG